MTIKDIFEIALTALAPILLFIQFLMSSRDKRFQKLVEIEKRIDKMQEDQAEEKAKRARARIIRFSDECKNKVKHSEEMFNDSLADITEYNNYCKEHPLFENEKTVASEAFIKQIYNQCLVENDFL